MADEAGARSVRPQSADPNYIASLVRAGDQDRYWAGLLMPAPQRAHLLALYAFNIELARIGEQAREPALGEIRLQWWRDVLASPPGALTGNPVADALTAARTACDLPQALLDGLIEARSLDVHRDPVATMPVLEAYLVATAGGLFRLGAWIAGACDEKTARASNEAALAYGLTGLMRALPYHVTRGQLYLPADFLGAFGVEGAAVLAGKDSGGLKTALGVLRERAREHLGRFRALEQSLPSATLAVFLPLALVPAYLRRLGNPTHRPLTTLAELNPLARYTRIWLANLRGRV
jgi:15-cis-phytoene synthase